MVRKIGIYVFPDFQLLDMSGPASAFDLANISAPGSYEVRVIAEQEGLVKSSCGIGVAASSWLPLRYDTLVVAGGPGATAAGQRGRVKAYIRSATTRLRRVASVCSGTFILASSGILKGRRVTTHWSRAAELAAAYPDLIVEPDQIYICEGNLWTSAGITAGIDLALAMIAQDLGWAAASNVAEQLVVYFWRPGGYVQRSSLLMADPPGWAFSDLMGWVREHLAENITVERLAERVAMSPRNFARAFLRAHGATPAKAIEQLRLEVARELIEQGRQSFEQISFDVGFRTADRMRRAFLRGLGESPRAIRHRMQLGN